MRLSYSFNHITCLLHADTILQQNEVLKKMNFSRLFLILIKVYTFNLILKYAQFLYQAHGKTEVF